MVASDESTPKETSASASESKPDSEMAAEHKDARTAAEQQDVKAEVKPSSTQSSRSKTAAKKTATKKKTTTKKTATQKSTAAADQATAKATPEKVETNADEVTTASQTASQSGGVPGGIVGLILLLLVAAFGGGFVASLFGTTDSTGLSADTSDLEAQITRLEQDISTLKATPTTIAAEPVDLAPLEESVTTLENRVAGLEQALLDMNDRTSSVSIDDGVDMSELNALMDSFAQVNDDIATLRREMDENLGSRVAALEETAPPSDLEETLAGLAPRQNLVALLQRLSALEQDETGSEAKQAAFSLAVANLARASQMGQPFAQELEAITILSPDFQVAAALQDVAKTGLHRRDQLITDFGPTARSAFSAQWQSENASWWDNLVANLQGLITIRQTGEVEGESLEAIIARTETHLGKGDLPAALAEVKTITGPAGDVLADWRTQVEAHVQLDDMMRDLNTNLLQQFSETGE